MVMSAYFKATLAARKLATLTGFKPRSAGDAGLSCSGGLLHEASAVARDQQVELAGEPHGAWQAVEDYCDFSAG